MNLEWDKTGNEWIRDLYWSRKPFDVKSDAIHIDQNPTAAATCGGCMFSQTKKLEMSPQPLVCCSIELLLETCETVLIKWTTIDVQAQRMNRVVPKSRSWFNWLSGIKWRKRHSQNETKSWFWIEIRHTQKKKILCSKEWEIATWTIETAQFSAMSSPRQNSSVWDTRAVLFRRGQSREQLGR